MITMTEWGSLLVLALSIGGIVQVDACTTMVVGRAASAEGAPMSTSTGDDRDADHRLARVPARRWPKGALRPVFAYNDVYPHVVQNGRSTVWESSNLDGNERQLANWSVPTKPIGYIPQVENTFALYETGESYGLINEFQVGMGESTCPARFVSQPVHAGGRALLDVSELSKIALERSRTARQAIEVMGQLAEKYGYYGACWTGQWAQSEAGEALMVSDPKEAWVFHICPDDTGASAVWAAQRIPDDHIAVVANSFVLKEIDPSSDDFMYSSNMYTVAKRNKLWSPTHGKLHFAHVFGMPQGKPAYATRRVWRVFQLAAPSKELPSHTNDWGDDYPLSIQVDRPLSIRDMFRIQRDHYEGTAFDLTQGRAAGPFGDPDRFDPAPVPGVTEKEVLDGFYERSIILFRTAYSYVTLSREQYSPNVGALIWFAPHAPTTSVYLPMFVCADSPRPYQVGSLFAFHPGSMWWRVAVVSNYAHRVWIHMHPFIKLHQEAMEDRFEREVKEVEKKLLQAGDEDCSNIAGQAMEQWSNDLFTTWENLFIRLVAKFRDGVILRDPDGVRLSLSSHFYPMSWLNDTGFWDTDKLGNRKRAESNTHIQTRSSKSISDDSIILESDIPIRTNPVESSLSFQERELPAKRLHLWGSHGRCPAANLGVSSCALPLSGNCLELTDSASRVQTDSILTWPSFLRIAPHSGIWIERGLNPQQIEGDKTKGRQQKGPEQDRLLGSHFSKYERADQES